MRIVVFINQLGIGGSEKAACRWARGLATLGHELVILSLTDGPRRAELEAAGLNVQIASMDHKAIQQRLKDFKPDVIHAHAPGHPHRGDILGQALSSLPKIPVLQTNIFGRFENPDEDAWTDFRSFISWTSCVQAARRSFRRPDETFFRRNSVAVYPIDPDDGPSHDEVQTFRARLGLQADELLFGRLSRPEPNKWSDLLLKGFRLAAQHYPGIKLLLREPPPAVRHLLEGAADRDRFIILPATSDSIELARTVASFDVVLHTSIMGESFGYGIAEPMNYGKPVIANSTPWLDQAQIELVRDGECGFIASSPRTIANAMLKLANDADLRRNFGRKAKAHIRSLADPIESSRRLEAVLQATATGRNNPHFAEDLAHALAAASYLDKQQFGHSPREQIALRPRYYWTRFHEWRHVFCGKRRNKAKDES
jgi:glycosyltransferase involved in cell wall biosynthesis